MSGNFVKLSHIPEYAIKAVGVRDLFDCPAIKRFYVTVKTQADNLFL